MPSTRRATANATRKSAKALKTAAAGMMSLGKYTFVISPALPTTLFALLVTAFAK